MDSTGADPRVSFDSWNPGDPGYFGRGEAAAENVGIYVSTSTLMLGR